jgi:hypothetical protein
MRITIFIDFPNNIVCFEKPSVKELVKDMSESTTLSEDQILDAFAESLAAILVLDQTEGGWEELFELLEPKQLSEDGELEPADKLGVSEGTQEDLRTGARNLVTGMKAEYPELFEKTERMVEETRKLREFLVAAMEAQNDPELAKLLEETPKGQA